MQFYDKVESIHLLVFQFISPPLSLSDSLSFPSLSLSAIGPSHWQSKM